MDKLKMHSKDKTQENFEVLQKLFPNAVTETIVGYDEDGKAIVERAIDKDVLQQEINAAVVEGKDDSLGRTKSARLFRQMRRSTKPCVRAERRVWTLTTPRTSISRAIIWKC